MLALRLSESPRLRSATPLAGLMLALAFLNLVARMYIISLPHPRPLGTQVTGNSPFAFIGLVAFSLVGLLIVSRRPRHPVGWIYSWTGLATAICACTTAYAQYAAMVPGSLPLADLVQAVSDFTFIAGFGLPITLGLLLFPDGLLPSARWRFVPWLTGVGFVLFFLANRVDPALPLAPGLAGLAVVSILGAILLSVVSLVMRWRRSAAQERAQLKWVMSAGVVFCTLMLVAIGAGASNLVSPDSPLPFLLITIGFALLPVASAVAILKYHLYEIDVLINRTLVYVPLTAILAGVFAASITLSQKLFVALTGQQSDAATALTTLIVVALFEPLKSGLQNLVDRRLEPPNRMARFKAYGDQVEAIVQVMHADKNARRLLDEALTAFDAKDGAVYVKDGATMRLVERKGDAAGPIALSVPIETEPGRVGILELGARRNGSQYGAQDEATLRSVARAAAEGIALTFELNGNDLRYLS